MTDNHHNSRLYLIHAFLKHDFSLLGSSRTLSPQNSIGSGTQREEYKQNNLLAGITHQPKTTFHAPKEDDIMEFRGYEETDDLVSHVICTVNTAIS